MRILWLSPNGARSQQCHDWRRTVIRDQFNASDVTGVNQVKAA
jgi:hypothetical protein